MWLNRSFGFWFNWAEEISVLQSHIGRASWMLGWSKHCPTWSDFRGTAKAERFPSLHPCLTHMSIMMLCFVILPEVLLCEL